MYALLGYTFSTFFFSKRLDEFFCYKLSNGEIKGNLEFAPYWLGLTRPQYIPDDPDSQKHHNKIKEIEAKRSKQVFDTISYRYIYVQLIELGHFGTELNQIYNAPMRTAIYLLNLKYVFGD